MSVEAICRKAAHDGQRYAALADVNTLSGAVDFVRACAAHGLRPVVGVDVHVPGAPRVLLLARGARGYGELCTLCSHLLLSAGAAPEAARFAAEGEDDAQGKEPALHGRIHHPLEARPFALEERLRALTDVLVLTDDAALLERLAPHAGERLFGLAFATAGAAAHRHLFDAAARLRRPAVAAHDVYFMTPADYAVHRTLRAVGTCSTVDFLPEGAAAAPDAYWVDQDWMLARFASPAPVYALRQVLEQIDLRLDFETNKPAFYFPLIRRVRADADAPAEAYRYLRDRTWEAYHARYPDAAADAAIEAGRRVEKELAIIAQLGFADYFLIAHDVVQYARDKGYQYLGRGSGASSFVAFLLGITQVNPLVLDLYFERFLNPERSSPPDFDLDFSWRDRDDVLAYVFERFGTAHVAMLSTHVTLRGRGAIREIGRTLGLTDRMLSTYTKRLPSYLFDSAEALQAAHPEARGLDAGDPTLHQLLAAARVLIGAPVHYGVHAGGLVITTRPITAYTALTRTPKGLPITQLDMHGMEAWRVLKLDVLSTRGLGTFTDALAFVRPREPEIDARVADARVLLADAGIRQMLRAGDSLGLFYAESPGMRSLLRKLRVQTFEELTAASSIIRPGVSESGMMQAYIDRHRHARGFDGPRRRVADAAAVDDPDLADLLRESYGVMIYQEDVLKVAHVWAGLTLAEADLLRRAMSGASRSFERIAALRGRFFTSAAARGRAEAVVEAVWRQIASFAGYAFCKSHSASYAKLTMQQAYLKVHHPAAFLVGVLRNGGGFYHAQVYVFEALRRGVPVLLPCAFQSEAEDTLVVFEGRDAIRLGLGRVRGLTAETIRRTVAARRQGAFLSLEDYLARTGAAPEEVETLVDVGAFDAFDGDGAAVGAGRRRRAWELHLLLGRRRAWTSGTPPLFPVPDAPTVLQDLPPLPPYTPREILHVEVTCLGFPLTYHPMTFVAAEAEGRYVCSDDLARHAGRRVRMVGWLMAAKRITTRRRQPMSFLTLYDGGRDLYEGVLFPPAFARCARYLDGCGPYELEGKVIVEHGLPSLDVRTLQRYRGFAFESDVPWQAE